MPEAGVNCGKMPLEEALEACAEAKMEGGCTHEECPECPVLAYCRRCKLDAQASEKP